MSLFKPIYVYSKEDSELIDGYDLVTCEIGEPHTIEASIEMKSKIEEFFIINDNNLQRQEIKNKLLRLCDHGDRYRIIVLKIVIVDINEADDEELRKFFRNIIKKYVDTSLIKYYGEDDEDKEDWLYKWSDE